VIVNRTVIQFGVSAIAIVAGIWSGTIARAASLPMAEEAIAQDAIALDAADSPVLPLSSPFNSESELANSELVAQFFPYANSNEQVVMVQGQGTASVAADAAAIELVFVNYDPFYDSYACYYDESGLIPETIDLSRVEPCPAPPEPQPLSRATLQPAIDALTSAGISRNEIRLRLPSDPAPENDFATLYYPDSASLSLTAANPTRQQVQELITAVENAVVGQESLYLQDRYVQYTLSDAGCQTLERDAYRNAVANAQSRATVLAEALGVEIGDVPSVADSAFSLSGLFGGITSGLFGTTTTYCDAASATESVFGSFPSPSYYDPLAPAEVRSQRSIFVTYPVRRGR
jgi:hypothetical protein